MAAEPEKMPGGGRMPHSPRADTISQKVIFPSTATETMSGALLRPLRVLLRPLRVLLRLLRVLLRPLSALLRPLRAL